MRTKFYTLLSGLFGLFISLSSVVQAQGTAHHVVIANGGQFGPANFATIATYELATQQYAVFDSLPASSVQDLVLFGDKGFLAADSFLVKYNLDPYFRMDTVHLSGVRKIAVSPDGSTVVVTRGFGASSDYVQAFDLGTMNRVWTAAAVNGQCEGLAIWGDSVYVAVPGAFGDTTGRMAILSLADGTLGRYLELGTSGRGIGRVYAAGGSIWTINSLAFGSTNGFITQFDPTNQTITQHAVPHGLSGGAGVHNGLLYAFMDGNLGTWNPSTSMVSNAALVPGSWAGSAIDTSSFEIYLTATDYATFGKLYRYSATGTIMDSVDVGISPEAIALDNHISLGTADWNSNSPQVKVWPNPVAQELYLDASNFGSGLEQVTISDLMGRNIRTVQPQSRIFSLDLSDLPDGTYLVRLTGQSGIATQKIIKTAMK